MGCSHKKSQPEIKAAETPDPYLWLEDVKSAKSLGWVEEQNKRSLSVLQSDPRYLDVYAESLKQLEDSDKIPMGAIRGEYVYNFWRDSKNIQGVWRRTSIDSYKTAKPKWEVLIDFDELSKKEKKTLVYKGVDCLEPENTLCMIRISNGGSDASELREFDTQKKRFVSKNAFFVPEAKSRHTWLNKDTMLVGSDFGPESLTDSGYPRQVRLWKRGTPLAESTVIFEGEKTDVSVGSWKSSDPSYPERTLLYRYLDFYNVEYFIYNETTQNRKLIPVPHFVDIENIFQDQIIFKNKKDWKPSKHFHSKLSRITAGSLFSVSIKELLSSKPAKLRIIWSPDSRSALMSVSASKSNLILNISRNVTSEIWYADIMNENWKLSQLQAPSKGSIDVFGGNAFSDFVFFSYESFLTPKTVFLLNTKDKTFTLAKEQKSYFDASTHDIKQFEAKSKDGEMIPYFVIAPKKMKMDGNNPTYIYAYGGFESSMTPWYSGTSGKNWLEKGGVFVLANIRGGGEFGPRWHQAALKTNRQKAFDDLHAVAEDLTKRKISNPRKLGIMGGSNGGLLVGAAFTQRPELYSAVVCAVPLLDMLRYHKLLAGASWMAEYGDPDVPEEFEALRAYSPYHNLHADKTYPEVFFTTSTKDDRVHPGHARKMVARMNELGLPNLYYENTEGGHAGAANLRQSAKRYALQYIYLYQKLMDAPKLDTQN